MTPFPKEPGDEDWDDDFADPPEYDWEEEQREALIEIALSCRCGAWGLTKNGQVAHVADCICGAG